MNNTQQLSLEMREACDGFLPRRREIALLSVTTISCMAIVGLYQLGVFKHLPEPRSSFLDADKIHASKEAYALFRVPDAVLGLGSYAVTLGLTALGGKDRAKTHRWIPLALAIKALSDAAEVTRLTRRSWTKNRAFSIYSLAAAAATFAVLPLVIPEAMAALRARRR